MKETVGTRDAACDRRIIDDAFNSLIAEIKSYRPGTDLGAVYAAFEMARGAHEGQYRISGEPFVMHPISVAIILAEIKTDLESIVGALLHDVVEDTNYSLGDIKDKFGDEVAGLVDGVTKIEKVQYISSSDEQAENYRKMFFHMSQDVRVLLIKIADRLHNMRTLGVRKEEKQREIAQETLDIYAPLAHKLGVAKLRYELEDYGFKYLNKAAYAMLKRKVEVKLKERQAIVDTVIAAIRERLARDGIDASIEGRPKRFYSIYKKMKTKNKGLDELYDLYGVRVLVDDAKTCYEVLGRIHEMFTPMPGRFKDYIGMKKPNGYQSIHTAVLGPGEPVEVQIRTHEMHRVAEYGMAAHWKYKEGGKAAKDKWLQEIMEMQLDHQESGDYLNALKTDLSPFKENIYCFSPKGEIVPLVAGSTVVDYAYAIHSEVGNRMTGAKVEGRIVPASYVLKTGDRVQILTSQTPKGPNRDWLRHAKTSSAKSKINQWFNRVTKEETQKKGAELLEAEAAKLGVTLEALLDGGRGQICMERFNCKTIENLCVMVGSGGLKEKLVINHLYREYEKELPHPTNEELIEGLLDAGLLETDRAKQAAESVSITGVGPAAAKFARCCGPLPGDDIIGYVTRGHGLTVHRSDCANVAGMNEQDRRRLIVVEWAGGAAGGAVYHTHLKILCSDRDALIHDVSSTLRDERVKITKMDARTSQSEAIFNVSLMLHDSEQLRHISGRLMRISGVHDVVRVYA